jgi:murein DD-endopeptidase MepM/ murein hydrolase activator NlpD
MFAWRRHWLITRALPRYLPRAARFVLWSSYAFILFLGCAMPSLVVALAVWHAQPEQGGIMLMDTVGAPTLRQTAVTGGVETEGLLPYPAGQAPAPLNALHSRGGEWHGRDYVRECGAPLYAPFSGTVTRGGAGIKDSWGNPYMYLKSADGRYQILLMHGDYVVSAGQRVEYGQHLGGTNLHGYFIGSRPICHDHLSLLDNGVEVDPEKYRTVRTETAVLPLCPPATWPG